MNEFVKHVHEAEEDLKRKVASAMISGARVYNLSIEADKAVYLVAPAEQLMIASAPIGRLYDQKIENLLNGEPVLFVYFSEVEFKDGPRLPAGFYSICLRASQQIAEFVDSAGNVVAKGQLTLGARASGGTLQKRRVSTDIDGPHLCQEICAEVCLSLKVDLPGPWDPEIKVCVKVIIKV